RVRAGRVDECRGDTEGAILHRFTRRLAHEVQLRLAGHSHALAHAVLAHGGAPDEGTDVDGHTTRLQVGEPLSEAGPGTAELVPVLVVLLQPMHEADGEGSVDLAPEGCRCPGLAENLGGDPLRHL